MVMVRFIYNKCWKTQRIQARQNLGPRLQFLTFSDLHYLKTHYIQRSKRYSGSPKICQATKHILDSFTINSMGFPIHQQSLGQPMVGCWEILVDPEGNRMSGSTYTTVHAYSQMLNSH